MVVTVVWSPSHVWRFATPRTAARHAPVLHHLPELTGVGAHRVWLPTMTEGFDEHFPWRPLRPRLPPASPAPPTETAEPEPSLSLCLGDPGRGAIVHRPPLSGAGLGPGFCSTCHPCSGVSDFPSPSALVPCLSDTAAPQAPRSQGFEKLSVPCPLARSSSPRGSSPSEEEPGGGPCQFTPPQAPAMPEPVEPH